MTDQPSTLRPVGRFEWEQNLRRLRAQGLVGGSGRLGKNGKATRGGVSAGLFKAIAMILASYGELKGEEIYPGDAAVAVGTESSLKTVRDVRTKLIQLGMLELVTGSGRRRSGEWRLTMPPEIPAGVEMLTPAQYALEAKRLRDAARGTRSGGSIGLPHHDGGGSPTDHPMEGQEPLWGSPTDHPNEPDTDNVGWSNGPAQSDMGWSNGPTWGGPMDPLTKPLPSHKEHQANSGVSEERPVTLHARDAESETDSDVDEVGPPANLTTRPRCPHGRSPRLGPTGPRCRDCRTATAPEPAATSVTTPEPRQPLTPSRCPDHGLTGGKRADGLPNCTVCRALARFAPSPEGHLA